MIRQSDKFALGIVVSLLAVASFAQKPNLPNDSTASGDIIFTEIATPLSNPASGKSRFYVDSTLHLPCSMSATGVVTCIPASQSVTINTSSPLGGGGALSLGGTLTLTCATCNTSSATVTSFSAGTLSPLFTTSVATATTTPALTFALSNAAANTVFGNFTGSSGAPSYNALGACGDSTHALAWTAGTGFTCQAISAGSGTVSNIATTSPITGGPITTTGTIACATCAIGPGSSTANHLAKFSGTDGVTLADGGAIPAGTVTSIATTSPIGGGTITGTGTLTCTTCLTATSPTNHGVLLGAGSQAVGATGAGTSGQVLTSNGASADPTFQAAGSAGMTLLSTQTVVGSSTSQVTFSSFSAAYTHLYIVVIGRTLATDSVVGNIGLIFNSDTTAAHYPSSIFWINVGAGTIASSSAYGGFAGGAFSTSASGSTVAGSAFIDVPNYSASMADHPWKAVNASVSTGRSQAFTLSSFKPASAGTITSITITAVDGSLGVVNFASGTVAYLYGY